MALEVFERGLCACGYHSSLTSDRDNFFFTFEDRVCNVCAASAKYARSLADNDEKATRALGENPPPLAPRPGDGRRTFVKPLSKAEVEQRRASRPSSSSGPSSARGRRPAGTR